MEGKVKNVTLESGDSGYEVRCFCMEEKMGGGDYEPMMPKSYEYFFSEKDGDKAFKKFLELDKIKKGDD